MAGPDADVVAFDLNQSASSYGTSGRRHWFGIQGRSLLQRNEWEQ